MSDIHTWSATAANNNSAAPNGWPEGQLASSLNNCGREVMAANARLYKDTNGSLTTGGSANAYTLTPNRTISAYEQGLTFTFVASFTSSSTTPTLNVSALGAKTLTDQAGNALASGAITSGGIYTAVYDNVAGKFKLISQTVVASSLTPFAYCRFDSAGALQTGSSGVSSVVQNTTGDYTITLSSGVTNTAKAIVLVSTIEQSSTDIGHGQKWLTSTSLKINTFLSSTASAWNSNCSVVIYNTY